ncbi:MAG: hypothetical protein QXY82_04930 [Desulfurococcaceae archaeon]
MKRLRIQKTKCKARDTPDTIWCGLILGGVGPPCNVSMRYRSGTDSSSLQKAHASAGAPDSKTSILPELIDNHTTVSKHTNWTTFIKDLPAVFTP